MEPSSLPNWAQALFYIVLALGTAYTGIKGYTRKVAKEAMTEEGQASSAVISASFMDSKLLKELIETLREVQEDQGRDNKKNHRLLQDLRESINELNESLIVQTDTTMNLVRFINRQANKDRIIDPPIM